MKNSFHTPSFAREGDFIKGIKQLFLLTILILISFSTLFSSLASSQDLLPIIKIEIRGLVHVKEKEIRELIFTQRGEILSPEKIKKDMQSIYQLGYFSKIRAIKEEKSDGIILIYEIEENPVVKEIRFRGISGSEVAKLRKVVTLEIEKPWNYKKVKESQEKILEYLKKQGYTQAEVNFSTTSLEKEKSCMAIFTIKKGKRARVMEVEISGNTFFSNAQIRSFMQTRFKRYLDPQILDEDIEKIKQKYQDSGFYFVKIDPPGFHFFEKYRVNWVRVFLKIQEGKRFIIGKVSVEGNKIFSKKEIKEKFRPKEGEFFNLSQARESIKRIQDMYGQQGYIFAVIDNRLHFDQKNRKVDITISIKENNQVKLGQVKIEGNENTKWRVFKHTLLLHSGEVFNTYKIRESWRRLYNLGFFEKVEMIPLYTSDASVLDLSIKVKEREKMGKLLLGASYSSNSGVEGFIQLSKDNLWGQGKMISLDWEFGKKRNDYQLNYLDRWWRDTSTRLELSVYNKESKYYPAENEGYKKRVTGVEIGVGRPWFSKFSLLLSLSTQKTKIDPVEGYYLPDELESGEKTYQKIKPALIWDSRTRDEMFNVYSGLYALTSMEKSGGFLGGDVDFTKYKVELRTYFRYKKIWTNPVIALRLRGYQGEDLPFDEEFYIGGQETLRGYEQNQFRGSKALLGTVEFRIPINRNFLAYLFIDSAKVWGNLGTENYKSGFGMGVRMNLPLGVIRLDYGVNEEGKPRVYFGMGDVF